MGFSIMCKFAHVKANKSSKFLLKSNNYLTKSYIFNTKFAK